MAKRAKIALIATHDISATKKIFELNHGGKTRLTEISATVSCNCCFARGSGLCLHVIRVLMNVLQVNKHDKMLHQKAHSADNVLKLFSNYQPNNVARLANTVSSNICTSHPLLPSQTQTGSAGMTTASATRTTPRPPSPGPTQTGSSGVSTATKTTPRPPLTGQRLSQGSAPLHRPAISVPYPTPKVGQYVLTSTQYCHQNVEKSFGGQGGLRSRNRTHPPPTGRPGCRWHDATPIYRGRYNKLKMSNTYFHANEGCIKCRLPNFSHTLVDIQPGLSPLSHADKTFLLGNLNLSI